MDVVAPYSYLATGLWRDAVENALAEDSVTPAGGAGGAGGVDEGAGAGGAGGAGEGTGGGGMTGRVRLIGAPPGFKPAGVPSEAELS